LNDEVSVKFALGTFSIAGAPPFPGLVVDEKVLAIRSLSLYADVVGGRISGDGSMLEILEDWQHNLVVLQHAAAALIGGSLSGFWQETAVPVSGLHLHAPIQQPRQILMTRANYREHVVEMLSAFDRAAGETPEEKRANIVAMVNDNADHGDPFMFVKLPTCVAGPNDTVELPPTSKQPDWELELAIVIGKPARSITAAEAEHHIAGYCIVNDLSNRDLTMRDYLGAFGRDWVAAKCSPGFLPMGPYLVPSKFISAPNALELKLWHNGKIMQDASTDDLLHGVRELVAYASRHIQLLPGDIISTGSPDGNGLQHGVFLQPGDVVEGEITGLGRQRIKFR